MPCSCSSVQRTRLKLHRRAIAYLLFELLADRPTTSVQVQEPPSACKPLRLPSLELLHQKYGSHLNLSHMASAGGQPEAQWRPSVCAAACHAGGWHAALRGAVPPVQRAPSRCRRPGCRLAQGLPCGMAPAGVSTWQGQLHCCRPHVHIV